MRVYTHVSSSACQAFMFSVWNMFVALWVNILLGETKVYDVNDVLFFGGLPAYQKVLWLHISVDKVF